MDLLPVPHANRHARVLVAAAATCGVAGAIARMVPLRSPAAWCVLASAPVVLLVLSEVGYLRERARDRRAARSWSHMVIRVALVVLSGVSVMLGPGPAPSEAPPPVGVALLAPAR